MMDTKIAAIALVLIVAIPIMLGYALALDEEEITGWQTTDKVNITDMMNNSTDNIYVTSTAPINNAELYARIFYPGSGVTETTLEAPNYISTGSVYTTLPTYSTVTGTFTLNSSVTETTTGTIDSSGNFSYTNTITDMATYPWIYITTDQLSQINTSNGASLGTAFGPFVDNNGSWYGKVSNNSVYYWDVTSIQVVSDRFPTYTISYRPYTTISADVLGSDYSFTVPAWTAIRLSHLDGTPGDIITPSSSDSAIIRSGSMVMVNGVSYSGIANVDIATPLSTDFITYSKLAADGYADPSYGWNVDLSPGNAVYPYWMNGSANQSIRMMIAIENSEFLDLQCIDGDNNQTSTVSIRKTAGMVTVGGTQLGQYSYLCADISGSSVTVSGISAWPNMYTAPNLINSVTVDMANTVEDFVRVYLSCSSTMEFRVDSAEILSGTFATIENYTLTMTDLWPTDSYSVAMTSVGIYGDSIGFAGNTFAVTDGKITVNGTAIPLRNAVFAAIYDDDTSTWSNQINGVEITTSATPSTIVFGGEWSMTAAAYKMEEVTSTELVWTPGEFAFEGVDENFALMGLLTCVGLFIALAMYGRRSGAKVGTLMIICGCAGFVFLALM